MAGDRRWKDKDVDILRKEYGITPIEELCVKLNRTKDAIHWKASKDNIKFNKKENFDFEIINNIIDKFDLLTKRLNVIENKIDILLESRGYEKNTVGWKTHEEDFLKDNYGKIGISELASVLNRGAYSILNKAQRMGLRKKMNKQEYDYEFIDKYLIDNYRDKKNKILASELDIPYNVFLARKRKLINDNKIIPKRRS